MKPLRAQRLRWKPRRPTAPDVLAPPGLQLLPPDRTALRGGFPEHSGEETMEEPLPVDETSGDWFDLLTTEELELYMEIMLFGEPVDEEWLLTDEEYEQLMLEMMGL